ncbi:MAG: hypothetical protein MZU97_11360 [Bacillus subtilis]|nr:hypothetical protein [Bacillus subtilis]
MPRRLPFAVVVALAITIALMVSTVAGAAVPLLCKLGQDRPRGRVRTVHHDDQRHHLALHLLRPVEPPARQPGLGGGDMNEEEKEVLNERDYRLHKPPPSSRPGWISPDSLEAIAEYHPFDVSNALITLTPEERVKFFAVIPVETAANLFEHFEHEEAIDCIKEIPTATAVCDHRPHGDRRRRRPACSTSRKPRATSTSSTSCRRRNATNSRNTGATPNTKSAL